MVQVGDRVVIAGLKARPDLNGAVGVILAPETAEVHQKLLHAHLVYKPFFFTHLQNQIQEQQQLLDQGRMKVTGVPKPYSLKSENLTPINDSTWNIDWTVQDNGEHRCTAGLSIYSKLGDVDRCEEYVHRMCVFIAQGGPIQLHHFVKEYMFDTMVNNTQSHSMYFCSFDQIDHHIILESYQGKARIFQTRPKSAVTSGSTNSSASTTATTAVGYTAREWASPTPVVAWSEPMKRTHALYGGSKELTHSEWRDYLLLLFQLQNEAQAIADMKQTILPQAQVDADKEWDRACLVANMTGKPVPNDVSGLVKWCNFLCDHPECVSIEYLDNGDVSVSSVAEHYKDKPFTLRIPSNVAVPFVASFTQLTGAPPTAIVFIKVFSFHGWQNRYTNGAAPGELIPIGWTISANTIQH